MRTVGGAYFDHVDCLVVACYDDGAPTLLTHSDSSSTVIHHQRNQTKRAMREMKSQKARWKGLVEIFAIERLS